MLRPNSILLTKGSARIIGDARNFMNQDLDIMTHWDGQERVNQAIPKRSNE